MRHVIAAAALVCAACVAACSTGAVTPKPGTDKGTGSGGREGPPSGAVKTEPAPEVLTDEMVISRSQPAVFNVQPVADMQVSFPREAVIRTSDDSVIPDLASPSLVENEFARDRVAGTVSLKSKADYCWRKIADDPDRYLLLVELLSTTRTLKDHAFGGGSAFAVSREGILLTNAHVVDRPTAVPLNVLAEPLEQTTKALTARFGAGPPERLKRVVARSLIGWFQARSTISGRTTRVKVALNYRGPVPAAPGSIADWMQKEFGIALSPSPSGPAYAAPRILAAGESYPGKDVAVLQVEASPDGNDSPRDRVICLPLADSDRFELGGPIIAMGYPGAAVDQPSMEEEAEFRVIPQSGRITQRMPMRKGWQAFFMNAPTTHGHSGGPVVDRFGTVVAMNVAGNDEVGGYNLAVPINVAKEFLTAAGITPDVGPLTERWLAAQRLYWTGRYAEAASALEQVAAMQESAVGRREANHFVRELLDACRLRATVR